MGWDPKDPESGVLVTSDYDAMSNLFVIPGYER